MTEYIEDKALIAELQRRVNPSGLARFHEALASVGISLGEVTEDLDCPIQDRCCCGPQPDHRVRFHRRGGDGCRSGETR